ncbi:MAG: phosphatase PAP2 family protein [Sulfurimonas sp.]|nr:phosphatase PAP2 family protein [Sulfurimonas sp.]MBU1216309.1 phosphatase PAP2 family protein [bacterium]MBU1434615.1 phosphatase PAP2 family protein [bacterium]MBU1502193.1 phosphatase PAP2 family protein [bacterium]MBU3939691.1 phosphatase PAP2 family protein [bacterium]
MIFSKKYYTIFVLTLVAFILFSYFFIDKTVAKYFLSNIPTYEHIGDILSIAGESHWYIGAGIIGFVFFKYYKKNRLYEQRFLFLLYINLFSGLISLLLKWIFSRIRPWGLREGHDEYGFLLFQNFDMGFVEKMKYHFVTLFESPTTYSSFPSGHTTTIVAVVIYLYILFPRYLYLWVSLAFVMAFSRVLANDHFVSDIFAGVIVGVLSTLFLYSKMKDKLEKNI